MCNSCCCCPTDGHEPPDDRPPPPPPSNRCDLYTVTIVSMNVTSTDDGFLGGDLEATFTFTVNGESRVWVNNDLGVGSHSIGITFSVPVPADSSTITVSASGVEDDTFDDDVLAGFTQVWGQAQNWGVGSQTGSASDSNITYTLNYTITCARQQAVSTVSRAALLAYGQDKAKQRKAEGVSETTLVGWSVDRLRRAGFELVQAGEREYHFKGAGTLPARVERRFGAKPTGARKG
jgi:hypothetical protein